MAVSFFGLQPPITHTFTNAATVIIDHNMGYKPHVTVIVNDVVIIADIVYTSTNRITINFVNALTGSVLLR